MSLYAVLGVDASASAAELHHAYRERARRLHPDRWAQGTDDERRTAEASMQELNAAWAVLSDPPRRREYDRSLAPPPVAPSRPEAGPPDEPDDFDDVGYGGDGVAMLVRVVPVLLVLAVLAAIFVFTAFARNQPPDPQGPSNTPAGAAVGDCVRLQGGRVGEIVACGVPNDGRVMHLVNRTEPCQPGERRADGKDGSSALCLM